MIRLAVISFLLGLHLGLECPELDQLVDQLRSTENYQEFDREALADEFYQMDDLESGKWKPPPRREEGWLEILRRVIDENLER